jgi:hypothetical protein
MAIACAPPIGAGLSISSYPIPCRAEVTSEGIVSSISMFFVPGRGKTRGTLIADWMSMA